jgi:hypothetical protein
MLLQPMRLPFTAIDPIGFVAIGFVAAVVAVVIATGLTRRGRRARHPALSLPESA